MRTNRAGWLLAATLMLTPGAAGAQILFDTGVGETNASYAADRGVAQGVLVDAATDLTGFGIWMRSLGSAAGPVDVKFMIWNSDHSALLFSQVLQVAAFPSPQAVGNAVLVQTNPFAFALQAGTVYHFGVIVADFFQPRTMVGVQSISDDGFTTQGALQLYNNYATPVRTGSGSATLALQLQGTLQDQEPPPVVVPEPVTLVLLGTGLAGIAGIRRRRRIVSHHA